MVMAMAADKRLMPEAGSIKRIVARIFVLICLSGHLLTLTQFLGLKESLLFLLPGQFLLPQLLVVTVFLQCTLEIAPRFRDILVRRRGHGLYRPYRAGCTGCVLIDHHLPGIFAFIDIGQPRQWNQ